MAEINTATVTFSNSVGFQAGPSQEGTFPGLIVIQEWWGLNDHIKDVTGRLAREGFVALAPDLYDGEIARDAAHAQRLLQSLDKKAAIKKLSDAVNALKSHPQVGAGRIGVIGFCMGGFYSLMLASHNADIRAAAPFYGHVPPDEVMTNLKAPVFYVYAGKDQHIPREEPDRLEQFLEKTGNAGQVMRYPNANHAFVNDTRKEVYSAGDAKDAWTKAVAFLKKHLGGVI